MYSIYKLINIDNLRTYIGMTGTEIRHRYSKHVRQMRSNTHYNEEMQADWNAGHDFIVIKLAWRKEKAVAKALETKLMNLEPNPYNIAMGNPGDFANRMSYKFTNNNRAYMYAEIKAMRGSPGTEITERYKISQSMVSQILHGHRVTVDPKTSFADVFFCDKTQDSVENPAASEILSMYKEAV